MNKRNVLIAGALFAGLAVASGAFGAHALKDTLVQNGRLDTYETAVRYQMYHALALLIAGALMSQVEGLGRAVVCWAVGIICFSGSLYALCFSTITAVALLTPIGGLFFLAGWTLFAVAVARSHRN